MTFNYRAEKKIKFVTFQKINEFYLKNIIIFRFEFTIINSVSRNKKMNRNKGREFNA